MSRYIKNIEISEGDYQMIVSQLNGYITDGLKFETTSPDQPPRKQKLLASWVDEIEAELASGADMLPLFPDNDSNGTTGKMPV